jgi:hypothetical protein
MTGFPRRRFPCGECPWRRDTEPGQFPACRYDALRATSDQPGLQAPMFGCHKGEPGTSADLACAGWLAVAGAEHLAVRMAVITGRLEPEDLQPGENWPELFGSYAEMAEAQGGQSCREGGFPVTATATICPVCKEDHDMVPDFWKCPDHGHAYVYERSDEWLVHDACPETGCNHGRWTG